MVKVYIIAGEASGDNIGAKLMRAMKSNTISQIKECKERGAMPIRIGERRADDAIFKNGNWYKADFTFFGIGGAKMEEEGLVSLFPMKELSVMGFVEIIPKIFKFRKLINRTAQDIKDVAPDVVITIDCLGFNKRVIKKLRQSSGSNTIPQTKQRKEQEAMPIDIGERRVDDAIFKNGKWYNLPLFVHYVAPTVWAYKPKRVYEIAELYDLLLTILPFENLYFERAGVFTKYVGHPVVDDPEISRAIEENKILLMSGSRESEIDRLAPVFQNVLKRIKERSVIAMLPTFPNLEAKLRKYFSDNALISCDPKDKIKFYASAKVALVKSGTSSVEMMNQGIPCVVAYKTNWLNYIYLRLFAKIKYISIANIMAGKEVIPEFIQGKCRPELIEKAVSNLIHNKEARETQLRHYEHILAELGKGDVSPAIKAAEEIIKLLERRQNG